MRRTLAAGTALLAVGAVAAVGWSGAAVDAASGLTDREAASLAVVGVAPAVVWGVSLRTAARTLGVRVSLGRAVAGFTAASFCNVVTPFGQTGGDPPAAAVVGRGFDTTFENGLATVGSVNLCNRVASVGLGLVALVAGTRAGRAALDAVGRTTLGVPTPVVVAGLLGLAVAVGVGGWRRRESITRWVAAGLATLLAPLGRLPRIDPPTRAAAVARADRFRGALDRLAADPRRLAALLALGVVGHAFVAVALWVAVAAVTTPPPLAIALLAIPVAKVGGLTPTPGGTGGVEGVLVAVLAASGVGVVPAGVAVVLHRVVAFWLPAAVGAVAAAWLTADSLAELLRSDDSTVDPDERDDSTAVLSNTIDSAADSHPSDAGHSPGAVATASDTRSESATRAGRTASRRDAPVVRAAVAGAVVASVAALLVVHRLAALPTPAVAPALVVRDAAVGVVAGFCGWLAGERVARLR